MNPPAHVTHLIDDYVLGLLTPLERARVERHAADCVACRQRLGAERALIGRVRSALVELPLPPAERRLPPLPRQAPAVAARRSFWMRTGALLATLLIVVGGGLSLSGRAADLNRRGQGDLLAATATLAPTQTHRATLAATPTAQALAPQASPTPIAGLPPEPIAAH